MANKPSSAAYAIQDMLEAGIDVSFFIGRRNYYHHLNDRIGIRTKEAPIIKIEVKVEIKVAFIPDNRVKAPTVKRRFNPDGTLAVFYDDWDND